MEMQFFVRSDVVHTGRDETGYPIEGLIYYVVAESESGRRLAHGYTFSDEGIYKRGEERAEKLVRRIERAYKAGEGPDWDAYWYEIDPAYGSLAYQDLDNQKFFRDREIMEAHEAGEINEREAIDLMMR